MLERIDGATTGQENIFGISPRFEDITWDGLNFTAEQFETITSIDKDAVPNSNCIQNCSTS